MINLKEKNIQFSYENFSQTPFWDHIKLSYSSQKITNKARSDEYCHQSTCVHIQNPQGLNLVEEGGTYKIKDKYNKDFKYVEDNSGYYTSYELHNSNNEKISSGVNTEGNPLDSVLINCEKLNCEGKKFRIYQEYDENYNKKIHLSG